MVWSLHLKCSHFLPPSLILSFLSSQQIFTKCLLCARLWAMFARIQHNRGFFFFLFSHSFMQWTEYFCPFPQSICWNIISNVMVFGAEPSWRGPSKRPQRAPCTSTTRPHSGKKAFCESGNLSHQTAFCRSLDPGLLWKISVVYTPPSLWYFVIAARMD